MGLTEFFNARLIDRTELATHSFVARWFEQHPLISRIVEHPIISLIASLVIIILLIRLFVAVYQLIINFIDRLWLWILRSPFLLIKFLFGWEVKPKPKTTATSITNYQVTSDSELLTKICDRLQTIEQQQQNILQEITSLKKQAKDINHEAFKLVLPESKVNHQ